MQEFEIKVKEIDQREINAGLRGGELKEGDQREINAGVRERTEGERPERNECGSKGAFYWFLDILLRS